MVGDTENLQSFPATESSSSDTFIRRVHEAEDRFVRTWERDAKLAAEAVARGARLTLDEAGDFAQEALIRLVKAYRADYSLPDSHVRTIICSGVLSAKRPCVRWRSRNAPVEPPQSDDDGDDGCSPGVDGFPSRHEIDPQVNVDIARLIDGLPDNYRAVYELIYVKGLTQGEAATRLHVTRQRVTQLHADLLRRGQIFFGCSYYSRN
jgi:RNA polymerase sigma factor (sigma-70 family)